MLIRCLAVAIAVMATDAFGADTVAPETLRAWIARDQVISVDLVPGRTVTVDGVGALAEVVPPGLLGQLHFPGVELEIQATGDHAQAPVFLAATDAHGSKTSLGADGVLENYVAGKPFSDDRIASAPVREAGLMVGWNHVHRWDYFGYRTESVVNLYVRPSGQESNSALPEYMSGGGAIERSITLFFHRVYLNYLPMLADQGYRMDASASERYLYKDYMEFSEPFDVAGARFVVERSLDPREEDQVNSYLPQERRVRRLSARERADGWMGTDFTLDDFEGFSGRVLDYEWALLGEKSILAIVDSAHDAPHYFGPMSNIPRDRWQLRDTWVVEAIPRWSGHPYGARIMFIDKQTCQVTLAFIVDRDNRLWKIFIPIFAWPDVDGPRDIAQTASLWRGTSGIDLVNARSTLARGLNTDHPVMKPSQVRRMFSTSSLTGGR